MFVLGTDESGYGPNLGPLVIAGTAWHLPEGVAADEMYKLLSVAVTRKPNGKSNRLAIADSKRLYLAGGSLAALERGVMAALTLLERRAATWREIWRPLDAEAWRQIEALPWHASYDESLPLDCCPEELAKTVVALTKCLCRTQVRMVDLQTSVLFPAAFNGAVNGCNNKAEVLSLATLRLARRILDGLPPGRATVMCDKHGGRNHYTALLQHVFMDKLVRVRQESPELSVYEAHVGPRQVEFRFQPKGERHLPTALASMTAKYLRELAMRPFNAFWQQQVPGLRATAGYATDSRRFFAEIRVAKERLGVSDDVLWRER